jgi:hypothetical protein
LNINGVSNPANIPQQMGLVTGAKHVDPTEDVSLQEAIASEVKTTEKMYFTNIRKSRGCWSRSTNTSQTGLTT